MTNELIKVGIVGASGYGGGELLRLLARHPQARVTTAISETYQGRPVHSAWPGRAGQSDLVFQSYGDGTAVAECDVVFLAMENGKAMETAPHLLEAGCKIVDLSADFRFADTSVYKAWYGKDHVAQKWALSAAFGLPEIYSGTICNASLVGNPGCYPTASILALAPLIQAKVIDTSSIIVDAKSGVSGAGRSKHSLDYHFPEVNESVSAYKIAGTHRHTAEIERVLGELSGSAVAVTFTPHLIPMTRGILATCYATLTCPLQESDVVDVLREFYASKPFVVVLDDALPATKHTLGSNRCHVAAQLDMRMNRVTVIATIDNLIKGMAGQAIQNMNLMCGLDETMGLSDIGGLWP